MCESKKKIGLSKSPSKVVKARNKPESHAVQQQFQLLNLYILYGDFIQYHGILRMNGAMQNRVERVHILAQAQGHAHPLFCLFVLCSPKQKCQNVIERT